MVIILQSHVLINRKHVRDFTAARAKNDLGFLKFDIKAGTYRLVLPFYFNASKLIDH